MAAVASCGQLMWLLLAAGAPEPSTDPEAAAPSKEMLLYLAEFEDASGEWVDPLEVTRESAAPGKSVEIDIEQVAAKPKQGGTP